ncbi:MAG: glycoside hydrolase family 43 protein [Prevotella sp.]|nr:glycoside hydrolase family 43 protein [Prevotella sp.]
MKTKRLIALCLTAFLAVSAVAQSAQFRYFSYTGEDQRFCKPFDASQQYLNPIRVGFYPDPSICRVGDTYYLVNSSFSFFPGVPLSTSKDLINWEPAGHVLDRESQLPLTRQRVSGGIYAPAITYNKKNKTFYMITTNVGRGNFFVKTKDPSKGWSEPIYLRKIDGIDPSFFFDDNGKGYIVHNAPVVGKDDYNGQRAIRLFEFDVKGDSIKGDFKEILRGGTHVQKNPIWIEGPHLFKHGKYYYLMCAEGGTGAWHSEVILRSKDPKGVWEECPDNPILTQRQWLDPNRPDIVTSAGHADLVEDQTGQWWAVFLACRPYEQDFYNTGRDTYLLPVTWKDGWPMILEKGKPIPTVNEMRGIQTKLKTVSRQREHLLSGNFAYTDRFDGDKLNERWIFLRNPSAFWSLGQQGLTINALPVNISERESLSAVWVRQQHTTFTAETEVHFSPASDKQLAGFSLLQNEDFNFVFGKTMLDGKPALVLYRSEKGRSMIASAFVSDKPLRLKIEGDGRYYSFFYQVDGTDSWQLLARGVDAVNLSTNRSGGFIGACIGLYATSKNE